MSSVVYAIVECISIGNKAFTDRIYTMAGMFILPQICMPD